MTKEELNCLRAAENEVAMEIIKALKVLGVVLALIIAFGLPIVGFYFREYFVLWWFNL